MAQTIAPTADELAAKRLVFRYNTRTDTYIHGENTGHPEKTKGYQSQAAQEKSIACYSAAESQSYNCTACLYSWEDGHLEWNFEHPDWKIKSAHLSLPYKTEGGSVKISILVDDKEVENCQSTDDEEKCTKFDLTAEGRKLTVKVDLNGRAMLFPQLNAEDPCGDFYVSIKFE
ncbi:uncharacterized protein LOC129584514 [Paramacrobiotus metropolitanus]|uniref:uncharacterized protein LOC129584514 n=1 Tax=Paramacrobiotus metropolitanus TaxID=2943436 RepID=UPI0024461E57|nr:uncharacterized protein LOC129584514 [Paramacrobiotus metropolitanus]